MRKQFEIGFSCEASLVFLGEEAQRKGTPRTLTAYRSLKFQNSPQATTEFSALPESRLMR